LQALRKRAAEEGCEVVVVSAKVESELNGMPEEEAKEWLEMLGVEAGEGGGLAALIRATYKTLGLQTYFTTGEWGPHGRERTRNAALMGAECFELFMSACICECVYTGQPTAVASEATLCSYASRAEAQA
jgi:hypothetical protein